MNSSSITMESTDSSGAVSPLQLPPGFRFHPTDEELVVHYLKKKVSSAPLPVSIIAEVDLYKFDPWDLPAKATFGDQEWYFFSPRDRKYPNGARPNRAATSGYWKATGTDKPVVASGGTRKVGVKKALVFYRGKPPKGVKTDWIMHEYRLIDHSITSKSNSKPPGCDARNKKTSLRLDDWVLCRIYKKNNPPSPTNIPFPPAPSLIQHYQSLNLFGKDNINPFEGLIGSTHDYTSNINNTAAGYISLLATSSGNKSQPPPFTTSSGFINTISTVQEGDRQTSSMALAANDLFTHLPQTVVGSLSSIDVLRQNHHLPGFNWYS